MPATAAPMAVSNTPAAATSLAFPISGSYCGETLSQSASMALLKHSAAMTLPMQSATTPHSAADMSSASPAATASIAAARCIRELCSSLSSVPIPLKAYLNERARALSENG